MSPISPQLPEAGWIRDHPLRAILTNEFHARPPEALHPPLRATYLAMLSGEAAGPRERAHVADLCARFDAPLPAPDAAVHSVDLGSFHLKWERHTEFSAYTVFRAGCSDGAPFGEPAISAVPADWLAGLAGERLVGLHIAVFAAGQKEPDPVSLTEAFGVTAFAGAEMAGGLARAWTDFRTQADGWGRMVLYDAGMSDRQTGRMVQRLAEIETYRMLALLALPLARSVLPRIGRVEASVAAAAERMTGGSSLSDDQALLAELSGLAAETARIATEIGYRFAAARAYHTLVHQRIVDLRESRIEGLQTFAEFVGRRLDPALATCQAVETRKESLETRIARAGTLLRTRVDVALEEQNANLLRSMNRRATLQLRLQETVEGLSAVAISYYS
ncbi:MAG: DUF3422 domain-containing protein, partial [Rhodopila sp.]|nr:DUF3422 domain-containing protein [Rhodopila sp.]